VTWTVPLARVRPSDRARVGGKAAGCAALRRLRLDVPDGFVVTTDAFRAFLEESGQAHALVELADPALDDAELARRCAVRQAAVRVAALPAALRAQLAEWARELAAPLAVRSSATSEDGARSSFAGVFDSALDVGADELADAVRERFASAFSHVSITHHLREGLDPRRLAMAVLVQTMVPAAWAGVIFSREPSGARPDEAVVSFTRGTGERLMGGEESGATLTLERASGRIIDGSGLLPEAIVAKLVETARRVEDALGHPQDLEWAARSDGRLAFLQTRPITTIEPLRDPPITWTRELAEERFPQPMSPLSWSALRTVARVNDRTLRRRFGLMAKNPDDIARTIEHHVYSNEGFFKIPGSMRLNPLKQARFFAHYAREAVDVLRRFPDAWASRTPFGPRWLLLSRLFRAFVLPHAREIERAWRRSLAPTLAKIDAFDRVPIERLSTEGLWKHRLAMQPVADAYMEPDLAIYVVKMACSSILEKLGEALHGSKDPTFMVDLTSGVSNRTLDMNEELGRVFERLRAEPALLADLEAERHDALLAALARGGPAAEAFAAFLERNGHNTSNWDMMQPTWGEEPRFVLALLRSYSRSAALHGVGERRAEQQARFASAKARALRALASTPWLAPFFEETLATLHTFMAIDEEHHFYCSRLYRPLRRTFAELGARLVARRALERPEDVYFLTLDEVRVALRERRPFSRRHLVAARRAGFARSRAQRPPERLRNQTPLPARDAPALTTTAPGTLQGVGASAGVATGTVRVVREPEDAAAFREGEVLVTASPNPVWTPLYAVASALVTSTGSLLSHGLVSAREYHLPAVIKIPDVTNRLSTGQRVRVDGALGTVTVEL
jgi:rifampicin phosphotransferase